MAIHLLENQYRGINAHLHSYLQQKKEWEMFHADHVHDLRQAIQQALPLSRGYRVIMEQSLQIKQYNVDTDTVQRQWTKPDVMIYQTSPQESIFGGTGVQTATPTATMPITETVQEPEYFASIMIYQASDHSLYGTPITRIELLSPANKPGGSHHDQYLTKRDETVFSGIKLVELDYLHKQRPSVKAVADYTRREKDSYPYTILVNNPLPELSKGRTDVYGFRVDDPIPAIKVPLAEKDSVVVDFNAIYQHTFAENNIFGMLIVDYEKLPEGFETYDEEDQRRIKARMQAVIEAQPQP